MRALCGRSAIASGRHGYRRAVTRPEVWGRQRQSALPLLYTSPRGVPVAS